MVSDKDDYELYNELRLTLIAKSTCPVVTNDFSAKVGHYGKVGEQYISKFGIDKRSDRMIE